MPADSLLEDSPEKSPACDCGWLRPKFTDILGPDGRTPLDVGPSFVLVFACPVCGVRWSATYGKTN